MRALSLLRPALLAGALASCTLLTGVASLEVVPDEPIADAGVEAPPPVTDAAAIPDAAQDGAADADAGPCPAFATFCDDLESGSLTRWTSLFQSNGGKVSVVDTPVFAGKHAMYAVAGPSTPVAGVYPTVGAAARVTIPPVAAGLLAIRARVFMPKILGAETTFLKVFAKNGIDDMNVKITSGGLLKVDTDTPDAGPELSANKGPPTATWFCIEWQATIATAGHQRLLVDGEVVLDVDENNFSLDGYDSVQAGFQAANGSVTQEIYFDDVIVATQPIGCP